MKTLKSTLLILFMLQVSCYSVFAQRQKNIWCFGDDAEVNFNSGSPVSNTTCIMSTNEGCASIADKSTGALLFYSDGSYVYNKNGEVMPSNTTPLGGNESTTQSALIVPLPGSDHLYYIFCTTDQVADNYDNPADSGTEYSIIDMNQDGGLGDVVQQPEILISPTTEKITATAMADNQGYWVVVHLWNSDAFYAYPLTAGGLGQPVISHAGIENENVNGCCGNDDAIGYMRISPDGNMIAMAIDWNEHIIQVFNFSRSTGTVGGLILSDNTITADSYDTTGPYGISFSPNSQLLYVAGEQVPHVYQYNLLAGTPLQVKNSRLAIGEPLSSTPFAMELGPDNKIYVAVPGSYLDCIASPNVLGMGCNYTQEAVELEGTCTLGLPEFVVTFLGLCEAEPVTIEATQHTICASDTASVCASPGFSNYQWSVNDTGICIKVTQAGTYSVTATNVMGCTAESDSVVIGVYPLPNDSIVAPLTSLCGVDSVQLCGPSGFTYYQWNDGETAACIEVRQTGSYYVTVIDTNYCHDVSNKVNITTAAGPPDSIIANQVVFCPNDSAQICAPGGYPSYQWNVGLSDSCITVTLPGDYYVTVTDANGCSAVSNRISIHEYASPPVSTSILHDTLHVYNAISCQWYLNDSVIPGATDSIYLVRQQGIYSVAITDSNGCTAISNGEFVSGIYSLQSEMAIKLYPDPAADEINISYILSQPTSLQVTITDMSGRLVQDVLSEKQPGGRYWQIVNIRNLASGAYMVNFATETGNAVLRFEKL